MNHDHHQKVRDLYAAVRSKNPKLRAVTALRWARLADKLHRNGIVTYGDTVTLREAGLDGNVTDWNDGSRTVFVAPYSEARTSNPYNPRWESHTSRAHVRWVEDTREAGLRWVGYADDLCRGIDHNGWYTDDDAISGEVLRGGVWQLPARDGKPQYVAGYADPNNRGAAAIDFEVYEGERGGSQQGRGYADDDDGLRDCARSADSFAKHHAEREREHQRRWRAGHDAAEKIDEIAESLDDIDEDWLPLACCEAIRVAAKALKDASAACENT